MGTSIAIFQTMNSWDPEDEELMTGTLEKFYKNDPQSIVLPFIKNKVACFKQTNILNKTPKDFELTDAEGQKFKLASLIGKKVVLIDFWASWCSPCREEMPSYKKIYT